ncbi:MAG: glycosyltransferase family 2 protein [Pirellulales bacterium]
MNTPRLSVIVLALNEAENLRSLIPQLRWADEVVVIDGGSTDGSAELAANLGATAIHRPFDNFAAQRNAAMAAAGGNWLFFIDADERPSPRLAEEVRLRIAAAKNVGYRVPIRSTIFSRRFRFSGTQNDVPLRLVRRDCGNWSGSVHETFIADGPIGKLETHLEHFTLPTPSAFLGKMQRYTNIAAEARIAAGLRPRPADRWLRPVAEFFRRFIWKFGWLDGPEGWTFCARVLFRNGFWPQSIADSGRPARNGYRRRIQRPSRSRRRPALGTLRRPPHHDSRYTTVAAAFNTRPVVRLAAHTCSGRRSDRPASFGSSGDAIRAF